MFQNLKVDIVYYKTATDFEMEFNLCGCCRMRLLTDKSPDKKTLVHSIARAVSRSRIIIVSGALFGENGIISTVSSAIETPLVKINNNAYGINGNDEIEIMKGAVPLVTADGYFGGCIIESGPQTMVIVSDNKSIRKSVMQKLIHPYIEELCALELKKNAASVNVKEDNEATEENTDLIEDLPMEEALPDEDVDGDYIDPVDEPLSEEPKQDTEATQADASNTVLVEDAIPPAEGPINPDSLEEEREAEDIVFSGFENSLDLANDKIDLSKLALGDTEPPIGESRLPFANDDYDDFYRKPPSNGRGLNIPILIISIILLVVLAVLCYTVFYMPSKEGIEASTYLREIYETLFL